MEDKEFILVCSSGSKDECYKEWKALKLKDEAKIAKMILYQGDKTSNKEFIEDFPEDVFEHVYFQGYLASSINDCHI